MGRVRFLNECGQRVFLDLVILKVNAVSLRGLLQFGFDVRYSTLKNYYNGSRLLPKDLFNDLCEVAGISSRELEFEVLGDSWGQVVGGEKGKRGKI